MAKPNVNAANLLADLKAREIFDNITSEQKFLALAQASKIYIGFDPTAQSLHLGNYIQIALLKRFAAFGFSPIAVLGGATGMIGDPSLRSTERVMLEPQVLLANKRAIKAQLNGFGLDVVDNYDWYRSMNVLRFLRDIGKQVNVNYMLAKESVKARLEAGLSFTEFTYQLIQGYDFQYLYDTKNVCVQVGGSDQWGNITTGVELIRKTHGEAHQAVGLTVALLTTSDGKKYGKSAGNAIWLAPQLTSPFALYQFLLNTPDADVRKLLYWLSMQSVSAIDELMAKHQQKPALQLAQQVFADELTATIHGTAAQVAAKGLTKALYDNALDFPLSLKLVKSLKQGITSAAFVDDQLVTTLVNLGAATSNREAREFITGGAIMVNGQKVLDTTFVLAKIKVGEAHLIRKGKRSFFLVTF